MIILIIISLFLLIFHKPILHGVIDGFNGTSKYRPLYDKNYLLHLETLETLEDERNAKIGRLEDEITMLEDNIYKRDIISIQLENELAACTDNKRKQVILSKLIALNKAGFKDREKVNKLKDKIKELE